MQMRRGGAGKVKEEEGEMLRQRRGLTTVTLRWDILQLHRLIVKKTKRRTSTTMLTLSRELLHMVSAEASGGAPRHPIVAAMEGLLLCPLLAAAAAVVPPMTIGTPMRWPTFLVTGMGGDHDEWEPPPSLLPEAELFCNLYTFAQQCLFQVVLFSLWEGPLVTPNVSFFSPDTPLRGDLCFFAVPFQSSLFALHAF